VHVLCLTGELIADHANLGGKTVATTRQLTKRAIVQAGQVDRACRLGQSSLLDAHHTGQYCIGDQAHPNKMLTRCHRFSSFVIFRIFNFLERTKN
jgi:hypothetical protein